MYKIKIFVLRPVSMPGALCFGHKSTGKIDS